MSNRRVTFLVGANVKNFERNMKKVERRFHQVGRQATFLGRDLRTSITVPVLAAGGAVMALAHNTAQYADRVSDLSDVTGISTDALQEWDFVAKRVRVSTDVISSAFSSLGRRMSQFQRGSGPAVDAARQLGVEFREADGSMRNADDLIMDLLGSLNRMPADLDRAGIGTSLFGRRWEMLAPIIGRGSDNIERIREEAHELGLVMDGEALEKANRFREEMVNFQEQMAASGRSIAVEFMPTILEFLPVAEKLIHRVGDAVKMFADMDQQTQINRIRMAAYAAAIGPALIMMGSLITSTGKLIGLVRALTVAMASNPFGLIAVGIGSVVSMLVRANQKSEQFKRNIESVLSLEPTGTADELEMINQQIVKVSERLEQANKNLDVNRRGVENLMDVEKEHLKTIEDKLESLIELRDEAAKLQMHGIISDRDRENSEQVKKNVEDIAQAMGSMRPNVSVDMPKDTIFDPTDEIFDIGAAMFNAQQMETWQHMIGFSEDYSHRLEMVNEEQEKMTRSMDEFGHLGIQIFDRLVWQGERFSQTLKSIGRQLATRGLLTLLTGGFGGGVSGFLGSVIGINDAIISPRGDIITPHPDDYLIATKDPGGMADNIRGAGGKKTIIENVINLDGRVIYRSMKDVEHKYS